MNAFSTQPATRTHTHTLSPKARYTLLVPSSQVTTSCVHRRRQFISIFEPLKIYWITLRAYNFGWCMCRHRIEKATRMRTQRTKKIYIEFRIEHRQHLQKYAVFPFVARNDANIFYVSINKLCVCLPALRHCDIHATTTSARKNSIEYPFRFLRLR